MENGASNAERVRGSEVFVGGLNQSVTEEMIREVFCKCGEIIEIRMMKDQNGSLKGYCFVRFTTREAAKKAQKEKNGMILHGKKIGVAPSTDQDTLFLGNLKKEWNQSELEEMVRQAFQDVESVELAMAPVTGDSPEDKKRQNRGFAFVHFISHTAAARAHRVGNRTDFSLGGKWRPAVDWAQSESEPDPDEMAKVTIAFVGNLPSNVKEDFLKKVFEPFGKIERVAVSRRSNIPVGFVHFFERSDLDKAIEELDGKTVDGPEKGPKFKLQVSVAKPADKSKKRSREDSGNIGSGKGGVQGKAVPVALGGYGPLPTTYGDYSEYLVPKNPRLTADAYELTVLGFPPRVTEKLLQLFQLGVINRQEVDIHILESLRELPESLAMTVLEKFGAANFAEIRNKGGYLASMINKSRKESRDSKGTKNASVQGGRASQAQPRDGNVLGIGGAATARFSALDSYNIPMLPTDPGLGYDMYGSLSSLSMVPNFSGGLPVDPLLTRTPTVLGDAQSLSSYRLGSVALNIGGLGSQEAGVADRRAFRFDPFTGEPFKFDPLTGEPLQPSAIAAARMGAKYF